VRHTKVLGFIHHGKVKGRVFAARQRGSQAGEHSCVGHQFLRGQRTANPLKNGPQHSTLRLGQPGLTTQAGDIAIVFPACQLPGIDDLLPLGHQKVQTELVATHVT